MSSRVLCAQVSINAAPRAKAMGPLSGQQGHKDKSKGAGQVTSSKEGQVWRENAC